MLQKREILFNICLGMNALLLFLALAGSAVQLPIWLQVTGRFHPAVLHFPIVLLLFAGLEEWRNRNKPDYSSNILLAGALTAAITALSGFFLSKEEGYNPEILRLHQWGGVAVSLAAFGWYAFRYFFQKSALLLGAVAIIIASGLVWTGHKGAAITHGENYLTAPLESKTAGTENDPVEVFRDIVLPIFAAKCQSCHNPSKAKGGLVLDSEANIRKGGKHGGLIDLTGGGLLLERLFLPDSHKEHMPPEGKTQLTDTEKKLLEYWIKGGANFKQTLDELPTSDSLYFWANALRPVGAAEVYSFPAASQDLIQKLSSDYCVVLPLAEGSPALQASFYGISTFDPAQLTALSAISKQLVALHLDQMPLTDSDLSTIGKFTELRDLYLTGTPITGENLTALSGLKHLKKLSLSGTAVTVPALEALRKFASLQQVYLWNTPVLPSEIANFQAEMPQLRIETGFSGDTIVAKLNAPVIEAPQQVFTGSVRVKLKNYIRGASIRYTLDGTEPDSLHSPEAGADSITISQSGLLRAKAFLPNWVSSEISSKSFYKAGVTPDSVVLLFPPNPQYKGAGANTLADKIIGDTEFRSKKWVGYRETPLEAVFFFDKPVDLSSISVVTLTSAGSYIMPPDQIDIYGGSSEKNLHLLKTIRPEQPESLAVSTAPIGTLCSFHNETVQVIKVRVKPLGKLPAWHPGKGDPGWVFIGEVFFN